MVAPLPDSVTVPLAPSPSLQAVGLGGDAPPLASQQRSFLGSVASRWRNFHPYGGGDPSAMAGDEVVLSDSNNDRYWCNFISSIFYSVRLAPILKVRPFIFSLGVHPRNV